MIRSITSNTPTNLLLGVGAFYKNYDPDTDTPATATSKLLGATDGGGSFSATPQIRQVSVDGAPGNVKGLETNDGWTAVLTLNAKELTADNLKLALGFVKTTTDGFTAKNAIADSDYVSNITWCGTIAGKTDPVIIVLKNALSLNGLNLSVADKSEASIPLTLTGHYSMSDLETPPFEIIYPAE